MANNPRSEERAWEVGRRLAEAVGRNSLETDDVGDLDQAAQSIVMRLLYEARMCRYDMLFAIQRLASRFTKWTTLQDKQLYQLMSWEARGW